MPQNTSPHVAVIGLGAMGLPMATHLAGAFPVTGFDIAQARRDLLVAAGGGQAGTPAEAAAAADVALLAVRDHEQASAALFGEGGVTSTLRPGGVVILTSTIGPDAARELHARLQATGHVLVDAPISGGPVRAGQGDLLIVVGAEDAALQQVRPVLDRLASTLTVVGPRPGDGQALKTINQLLAGVHIAAAAEAVALARGLGLDPAVVVGTLAQGAAGSFMLGDRGPRMLQAYTDEPAEVKSRIDIFVKDMGIVTGVGREAHVPLPLAAAAQQLYLIAEANGLGAQDDSTVVTVLSPATRP
ncbi:NAD(P)-dependent oxidoreductase [Nakamurella flavida]|uniref:NAD(P)-dependent oxidoreductase n=1 Tax=Nakamurella flavida TaxID=363630 RepID=A0A938YMJ2_9ACTN|nr:NAD(P)-dependent oxidoreductase [Nakamurella flavida]MBM9475645.1 NAD(P)-dependent oxidoreductase [Nakamurella flavida]MDP9778079.1 3-hydroxyisobutyrate dehydrogenase [Nakamurella flavida]